MNRMDGRDLCVGAVLLIGPASILNHLTHYVLDMEIVIVVNVDVKMAIMESSAKTVL